MDFRPVDRDFGAFQQPVSADEVQAMCRCAFGARACVRSAVELGLGSYNNAFRVDIGADQPVILRVAPQPARQFRIEREMMRNEHATTPFLAPIMPMMPRTLAIDFTHSVIGRDYMFQSMLPGLPAPDGLGAYPRPEWAAFYRQLGAITARIQSVRGHRFGPVAGPTFATWGDAVIGALNDTVADLDDAGLDAADVREIAAEASRRRALLDEITEPRLLHGDLWTANVMITPGAPEPTICGVLDWDRASWGDPAADWAVYMAAKRPGTEREAFWDSYGPLDLSPGAVQRSLLYRGRHIGAARLEAHRLRIPALARTWDDLREVLRALRSSPSAAASASSRSAGYPER